MKHLQRKLLAGLLVILPVVAAVWVFILLFNWVDGFLAPVIWRGALLLVGEPLQDLVTCEEVSTMWSVRAWRGCRGAIPGVGLITTIGLVYVMGLLATNVLGDRAVRALDTLFARFPLIGGVYSAVKQLITSVSDTKTGSFQRVVMIEFPVAGNWTVGFVTGDLKDDDGNDYLSVFVATAPNPTTGFAMVVAKDRAIPTPMSVEEGFKFLMSAGVVRPPKLSDHPFPRPRPGGEPAEPGDQPQAPIREVVEK